MKYAIFSLVFSALLSTTVSTTFASAAAPAPLLQIDQYSGFVLPSAAMEAHCSFAVDAKDGLLKIMGEIHKGRAPNGTWIQNFNIENTPSKAELDQAGIWINQAAVGPFQTTGNPCDIGTYKVMTANYPLIDSEDCGKKVVNLNPSAAPLIAWFTKVCFPVNPTEGTPE